MNKQAIRKEAYVRGAKDLVYILWDECLNLKDMTINIPLEKLERIIDERFDVDE